MKKIVTKLPLLFFFLINTTLYGQLNYLLIPENYSANVPLKPSFAWKKRASYNGIYSFVIRDSTHTTVYYTELKDSTLTIPINLEPNTMYYWNVAEGTYSGISGNGSDRFAFRTIGNTPVYNALISPANKEKDVKLTPQFLWRKTAWAEPYSLVITLDSTVIYMTRVFSIFEIKDTTFTVPAGVLQPGKRYIWNISYISSNNRINLNLVGNAFTTSGIPTPAAPMLLPIQSVFGPTETPVLSWNPVIGADSYCVQINSDSSFVNPIIDSCGINGTSFEVPQRSQKVKLRIEEISESVYFWRVAAINESGQGRWSKINQYRVTDLITQVANEDSGIQEGVAYPNPFSETLTISVPGFKKAQIKNLQGNTIIDASTTQIEVNSLIPGIYILQMETSEGRMFSQKLIKNK